MKPAFFEGLNDIDEATAKRRFSRHVLETDEVLTREGEESRGMAVVLEGTLSIRAGGAEVGRLGPGDLLGEMGLFAHARRTATVVALSPCTLSLLTREGYEELRDTMHPVCIRLERAVLATQVGRLARMGAHVASLGLGVPRPSRPGGGFFTTVARLFGSGTVSPVQADPILGLVASPLFRDAPEQVLTSIAAAFTSLDAPPGAFLCTEGEPGDGMFVLERGSVDVLVDSGGQPHHIATMQAGAAFGMVALAGARPRMSSCVAKVACRVHRLDRAGWDALVDEPYMVGSVFRRAVIHAFSDQLDYTNAQLARHRATPDLEAVGRALDTHDAVVVNRGGCDG